jgi:hypothetical protein
MATLGFGTFFRAVHDDTWSSSAKLHKTRGFWDLNGQEKLGLTRSDRYWISCIEEN